MKNRLTAFLPALAIALAPGLLAAASSASASQQAALVQIAGQVKEKCGQNLEDGLQAQLVDAQGVAVPGMKTPVASDGTFVFNNVPTGMYTVQILKADGTLADGTSAISAGAGIVNTIVTLGTARCGFFRNKTTLVVLGAAVVGGTVALIATRDEASPSR